ncbi:MAG: AEC family transporter, partial [Myxococcota bacterium]
AVLGPIAASAAPVALFLLGLYLYQERSRLVQFDGPLAGHIALCLLITPALTYALALGATTTQQLDPTHAQLHVLLASMPAAITTFAIAHQANVGSERVAGTIAWSTLGAAVTIPIWASLARWAFG